MSQIRYIDAAGIFRAKVVKPISGWFGESAEKKTPFVRVPVEIIDDGQGLDTEHIGKVGVWKGWLSDKAVDRTIQTLVEAFGWDGDLCALHAGGASFEGLECQITTEAETYNDKNGTKTEYKIKWLNPADSAPKQMDAAKVESLLKALGPKAKAIAKAMKAGTPAAAQPKKAVTPASASAQVRSAVAKEAGTPVTPEDDVPF